MAASDNAAFIFVTLDVGQRYCHFVSFNGRCLANARREASNAGFKIAFRVVSSILTMTMMGIIHILNFTEASPESANGDRATNAAEAIFTSYGTGVQISHAG